MIPEQKNPIKPVFNRSIPKHAASCLILYA